MNELKALVAFGKVGIQMMAARIVSIIALLGLLMLAFFVTGQTPSWQSVVVTAIVAVCFIIAVRTETWHRQPPAE